MALGAQRQFAEAGRHRRGQNRLEAGDVRVDRLACTDATHVLIKQRRRTPRKSTAPKALRKNYLFTGADCGGEHAAAIYSLIGTPPCSTVEESHVSRFQFETHTPFRANVRAWNH
jgi:hypothetical protein